MAKKTPESKEAAAERRQRELAALTSGVAAFSLMGEAPRLPTPEPAPVPAPVAVAPPAEPAPAAASQPEPKKPAPARVSGKAAPAARGGQETPAPAAVAAPEPEDEEEDEDKDELAEAEAAPAEPLLPVTPGELDLASLFVPSTEKKGTTLRITADHQQFFTNLGFILGSGASAPDIIHNILNRFRAEHEAQILKAMKKQLRQMMAPKK
ncbi:hypothetical protein GCM10027346_35990 [Hymenobacter seoulensis]